VIGTLLDRKLITTAGRKQVIGRPILYKTTKEFLMRFGLKDVSELPSMEEFEKLVAESFQAELIPAGGTVSETVSALDTSESEGESDDNPAEHGQARSAQQEDVQDAEPAEIEKSAAVRED
jgi:segregation and condensation protein B